MIPSSNQDSEGDGAPHSESPTPPSAAQQDQSLEDTAGLLRRYREHGDEAALERVFRMHYPRVERIVRIRHGALIARRADGADLVQEVMLRALRDLDSFEVREEARLVHWLATIAENELARHVRRERALKRDAGREVEPQQVGDSPGRHAEPQADTPPVPEKVARSEMTEIVDAALSVIPARLREVILLREYAGGSWEFVAEQAKCVSPGAARQLYLRAREVLGSEIRRRARPE